MANYKLMPAKATPQMEQVAEKYWNERRFKGLSDDPRTWAGVYQALLSEAPMVNIVATKNEQGQIVSVTLQDEDHRILEVIAEADVQGELIGYIRRSALKLMKNDELGVRANITKEPRYQDCVALYTALQPAEQQPLPCQECGGDGAGGEHEEDCAMAQSTKQKQLCWQSPPNDPLGGLEYRADGEANFYTLSKPTGNWIARIQFNGELQVHEQERILNAMLCDRNVRYGDGYHQGYWDARRDSPDVSSLVEALEEARLTLQVMQGRGSSVELTVAIIDRALDAYHEQEGEV